MRRHGVRFALYLLVVVVAAFLAQALDWYRVPIVGNLEGIIYDARLRLTMPQGVDPRIVIVDIDEKSLAQEGRWPWRRDRLGHLLDRLFDQYKAKVVGFDLVFAEADESSALEVLRELAQGELKANPQFQRTLESITPKLEFDRLFAEKMRGRPVVLGYYFSDPPITIGRLPEPVLSRAIFQGRNINPVRYTGFVANLGKLEQSAANAGYFNPTPDLDGVIRRMPMLAEYEGAYYEALSLTIVRLLLGSPPVRPGFNDTPWSSKTTGLKWLEVGTLRIPVDTQVTALVPYRGAWHSFPYVSAIDVLKGTADPPVLKDRIVLVGSAAFGLQDLRSVPVSNVYPGVEIHANLIAGMLDGAIKQRAPWAAVPLLLLPGVLIAGLLPFLNPRWAALLTVGVVVTLFGTSVLLWTQANLALPLVPALLMIAILLTSNLLAPPRPDRLKVAKRYFAAALATEVQQLGPRLLRLAGNEAPPDQDKHAAEYEARPNREAILPFALVLGRGKTYVVYEGEPPSAGQLSALRSHTSAQLVPISVRAMERALAARTATADDLRRLEEPFVMRTDPYDEQRPVEADVLFFGRTRALESIPAALLQGQHVGVFGLRKVGKTSLLNRLRDRLSASPCAWIDCQGYAPVAIDLFNVILQKFTDELKRLGIKDLPKYQTALDANSFREQFVTLHRAWSKRAAASRMIAVFDELDKYFPERKDSASEPILREYSALFRMLRALAQEHKCLSVLAVAYRPDINRQNLLTDSVGDNPMYMSLQEHFLGFLDKAETMTMIREIGQWRSIHWEDHALELVFELSGGHPLLARFIASDACEQGSRRNVAALDVEKVGSAIRNAFHRHRLGRYLDEAVWRVLRSDEREVLRLAALGNPGVTAAGVGSDLQDGLANLVHFGILIDQDGEHGVQGALLRDWIEKNEAQYGT